MAAERQSVSTRLWKVGVRRGMVYSEGKDLTERILSVSGGAAVVDGAADVVRARRAAMERFLPGTMAVYCDKKGRPFAWQIAFDIRHWDSVSEMVGSDG